jgi:aspartate 1-decarboxylase
MVTSHTPETMQTGNNWRDYKYYITGIKSFTIDNVSISAEGINENTTVEITITITTNNGSRDVTYSKKIKDLGLKIQK